MYWKIKLTDEELEILRMFLANVTPEACRQAIIAEENMNKYRNNEDVSLAATEFRNLPIEYKAHRIEELTTNLYAELDRMVQGYRTDDCRYIAG